MGAVADFLVLHEDAEKIEIEKMFVKNIGKLMMSFTFLSHLKKNVMECVLDF